LTEQKPGFRRKKTGFLCSILGAASDWGWTLTIVLFCHILASHAAVKAVIRKGADMNMIDDIAEVLVSEEQIRVRVAELGRRISKDYAGRELLLIGLLRGAIVFLSDLMRSIDIPVRLDFIGISSYGVSTESGAVRLVMDLETDISGRHVLVVEDIVDTGKTLAYLVENLKSRQPASLRVCALLDKPDRRQVPIQVDYMGFEIPDKFVVGYGLDFAEGYRNLPFVGVLKEPLYKKVLARNAIVRHLNGYLNQDINLAQLVAWARDTLVENDLSEEDESVLRDLVARAGEPSVAASGLTIEDCAGYLRRLGHELRVSIGPAAR
jgi:hypoxanthine phosphoribosyltransferase